MECAYMAASGTGLLVLIDDMRAYRSSRMKSDMYRAILYAQIQPAHWNCTTAL